MSGQLSYNYQMPKGIAGSLVDISPRSIDSRINGETVNTVMKYGMGGVQGATPGVHIVLPTDASTADQFEGVIMTGFTNEMNMEGQVQIRSMQTVGCLRWGRAWARVPDGVTPAYGDSLYLIIDGADRGKFTNAPSADTLAINGMFIGGLGTGAVAPVEIYNQKNA
jgi:hypothetical protein